MIKDHRKSNNILYYHNQSIDVQFHQPLCIIYPSSLHVIHFTIVTTTNYQGLRHSFPDSVCSIFCSFSRFSLKSLNVLSMTLLTPFQKYGKGNFDSPYLKFDLVYFLQLKRSRSNLMLS